MMGGALEPETCSLAAKVEDEHWWFCGRRAILRSVLDRYAPAGRGTRTILEVGCGSGGNLPLLAAYGSVVAVELDDAARSRASGRGVGRVEKGWLPDGLPFGTERFPLVAALDVLEHVEDDREALRALRGRLTPTGVLIVTVPAYRWLWGRHDEASHHRRRYTRRGLGSVLTEVGFQVLYATYFNAVLFPVAAAYVKLGGFFRGAASLALSTPPGPVNQLLRAIFSVERLLIPRVSLPYGVSLLVCCRPGRATVTSSGEREPG